MLTLEQYNEKATRYGWKLATHETLEALCEDTNKFAREQKERYDAYWAKRKGDTP